MEATNAMKTKMPSPTAPWAAVACALALLPALAAAQSAAPAAPVRAPVELALARGSRVWLDGSSTLHPYKIDATELHVHLALAPAPQGASGAPQDLEALARSGRLQGLELAIPVNKLRSGEGGLMDKNTWQALKAGGQPIIRFRMDSYRLMPAGSSHAFTASLQGHLSIAGTEKPVELEVHGLRDSQGLRLLGSKEVRMSEYGVKAPVLMMGTLKTDDKVMVHFDLRPRAIP